MIWRMRNFLLLTVVVPFLFVGCLMDAGPYACSGDCLEEPEASNQNSYVCECSCETTVRKIEIRVAASADDSEQLANGASDVGSYDLELSAQRLVGVRFVDVPIPQGADVLSAWVELTPANDGSGGLAIAIFGEDTDDAKPFSAVANDLGSRSITANKVAWSPGPWKLGDPPQQSPDLEVVLQEIVDRPDWAAHNALALVLSTPAGDGFRHAHSYDGFALNAPRLVVTYEDTGALGVGPQELPVCMPDYYNPNLGGTTPSDVQLQGDCSGRVGPTFEGLAQACGYPSPCSCTLQPDSRRFSDRCDEPCVEDPVDPDCSDFDPVGGNLTATNAPGDDPICITNSPLASGIFGRRSECRVGGRAHVEVDGESADPRAAGVVYFRGGPCPGERCAVGMEYRLDIDPVTLRNAFGGATFSELAGLGESPADSALIDGEGNGRFGPRSILLSARGKRGEEARAMIAHNTEAIALKLVFGSEEPMCALDGALVGGVDPETRRCSERGNPCTSERDCAAGESCAGVGSLPIMLGIDVAGAVVNQPPTADAGRDQTVECAEPAVLDGRGSRDLDGNLALFSWRRGGRSGPEVGFDAVASVPQELGRESYLLRVIDTFAQSDEDTTTVNVVDTMPPLVSCSLAMPVIAATNHSMVNVGLSADAHDACEGPLAVRLNVFADEGGDSLAMQPDAIQGGRGALRLRAERDRGGDGRVYLVVAEAADSSDNRGVGCCTAVVPYAKGAEALRSVQAQAAAAQRYCMENGGGAPVGYVPVGGRPGISRNP